MAIVLEYHEMHLQEQIMAFPAAFPESTEALSAPAGMENDVDALSVWRGSHANGIPVVISCWKLTAEELEEVNRTGRIWLGICGHTMPPAWIAGTTPF